MVLFRAENICGLSEIHAIITPTTKGIRKTLKDEGITFSMPLMGKTGSQYEVSPGKDESYKENINENITATATCVVDENCVNEGKNENEDEEGEETNEWLEKIGLNTSNLRVLKKSRSIVGLDSTDSYDNKPQSTILVQGSDVQALFNYLLNSKIIIANTGPMTGIPPTLLSYQCFIGATMQKLKVKFFIAIL